MKKRTKLELLSDLLCDGLHHTHDDCRKAMGYMIGESIQVAVQINRFRQSLPKDQMVIAEWIRDEITYSWVKLIAVDVVEVMPRLRSDQMRVLDAMVDGEPHTLEELSTTANDMNILRRDIAKTSQDIVIQRIAGITYYRRVELVPILEWTQCLTETQQSLAGTLNRSLPTK